jgi:hypothetical protein
MPFRLLELEAELANFERQTLRTITAEQKSQQLWLLALGDGDIPGRSVLS